MKKYFALLVFLVFLSGHQLDAQVLHTESFSVIIDTSRNIKGSIIPNFEYQNQKKNLILFENLSDISIRFDDHALTFSNKIELSRYGKEILLSGGYLYVEYRRLFEKNFSLEPFSQIHWTEARGLEFKYAGGILGRFRILEDEKMGVFAGTGPFYEYERWNYDGVKDRLIPQNSKDVTSENIKLRTYISFKWYSQYNFTFDVSAYHESKPGEIFSTPRLASSTSVTYNFTENLGLLLRYQNIYDYNPLVPIDQLYNKLVLTVNISF